MKGNRGGEYYYQINGGNINCDCDLKKAADKMGELHNQYTARYEGISNLMAKTLVEEGPQVRSDRISQWDGCFLFTTIKPTNETGPFINVSIKLVNGVKPSLSTHHLEYACQNITVMRKKTQRIIFFLILVK